MPNQATTNFLDNPTFLGLMILLVGLVLGYGGLKEWWVFGHEYRRVLRQLADKQAELEHWQQMAMDSLGLADRASKSVEAVAKSARPARRPRPDADS